MTHHMCHAKGFKKAVPPKNLMCGKHWAMVPLSQQREIWQHYRPGQEKDKRPSPEHVRMTIAVDLVARCEGRQGSLL